MAQARKEALQPLDSILDQVPSTLDQVMSDYRAQLLIQEVGTVTSVGQGVARVRGLPRVRSEELVRFEAGLEGMAYNLDPSRVGVIRPGGEPVSNTCLQQKMRAVDSVPQ